MDSPDSSQTHEPPEVDLTREEWESEATLRRTAHVTFGPSLSAAICDFDRETNAVPRAEWSEAVRAFLDTPMGPPVDSDTPVVAVLPVDLMGAWFDEIEDAGSAVLATYVEPVDEDGTPSPDAVAESVLFRVDRSEHSPNERLEDEDLEWCEIGASEDAETVAQLVLDRCEWFWWSGREGLEGWDVRVLWPLGNGPDEHEDNNRVGRELSGADPLEVARRLAGG
jgi:hypothetical protein